MERLAALEGWWAGGENIARAGAPVAWGLWQELHQNTKIGALGRTEVSGQTTTEAGVGGRASVWTTAAGRGLP